MRSTRTSPSAAKRRSQRPRGQKYSNCSGVQEQESSGDVAGQARDGQVDEAASAHMGQKALGKERLVAAEVVVRVYAGNGVKDLLGKGEAAGVGVDGQDVLCREAQAPGHAQGVRGVAPEVCRHHARSPVRGKKR